MVLRLYWFRGLRPDIDVRLSAEDKVTDFTTDDVDVALRFGQGDWPTLHDPDLPPRVQPPLGVGRPALAESLRRFEISQAVARRNRAEHGACG